MAYSSDESGIWEVYVQSFPEPGAKQVVSIGGGVEPRWRHGGRELFYLAPDRTLMAVDVQSRAVLTVGKPAPLFRTAVANLSLYMNHYVVNERGDRFLIDSIGNQGKKEAISLLANWPAFLKH